MRKIVSVVAGMVLLAAVAAKPANAQVQFGVHASWGSDTDFGLGARLGFPLGQSLKDKGITALTTFDFFFPDVGDYWQATANAMYNLKSSGSVSPFLGAGIGIAHFSYDAGTTLGNVSSTDPFLNLIGGLKLKPMGNVQPFVEARAQLGDGSQLVLAGGVYFGKP